MLPHKFNALLDDLNRFLLEMVSSNDVGKKMGALLVIDELIEVPLAENETKVIRFAHYLRMVRTIVGPLWSQNTKICDEYLRLFVSTRFFNNRPLTRAPSRSWNRRLRH